MATTNKKEAKPSKRATQDGEAIRVKNMGKGDGFHFTSGNSPEATGFYMKLNSKNNRACNLQNFKIYKFDQYDEAVPFALAIGRV